MPVEEAIDEVRRRLGLRGPRLLYRSLYKALPRALEEGEEPVAFGDGYVTELPRGRARSAWIVLTNRRLLALREDTPAVPLDALRAVGEGPRGSGVLGFTGGGVRIEADGGRALLVRVRPRRVADEIAAYLERRLRDRATTSPREATDPLDAIRRLGELRDAGLVSDEEFERKKAELLERL